MGATMITQCKPCFPVLGNEKYMYACVWFHGISRYFIHICDYLREEKSEKFCSNWDCFLMYLYWVKLWAFQSAYKGKLKLLNPSLRLDLRTSFEPVSQKQERKLQSLGCPQTPVQAKRVISSLQTLICSLIHSLKGKDNVSGWKLEKLNLALSFPRNQHPFLSKFQQQTISSTQQMVSFNYHAANEELWRPGEQWPTIRVPAPALLVFSGALWRPWQAALRPGRLAHFIFSRKPEFFPASSLRCPWPS